VIDTDCRGNDHTTVVVIDTDCRGFMVMVFSTIFNNIIVISWLSVLFEGLRVPVEDHIPCVSD
jgi:hypothetical protein